MTQPSAHTLSQNRPVWVTINQAAYQHNLARVRSFVPTAKVMAVIKADAYGHGMELAARNLEGAEELAVNSLDDVQRLRADGCNKKIHLLSAVFDLEQLKEMAQLNAQVVIYEWSQLVLLEQLNADAHLSIWIKVDTGMGRLGFLIDEMSTVMRRIQGCKGIADVSLMSHLSSACNPEHPNNQKQIDLLDQVLSDYDFTQTSLLNSAGVVGLSNAAYDMVRPGIMLYGVSPLTGVSASTLNLQPVMTFKSRLISVKRMPTGSPIGYNGTYTLETDTRIGIIACGYGDGYPRHAPNGTPVLVNGMLVPLVGRVSMDMMAVDLADIPADIGDEVILWGEGNPVEEVARAAGTIAYELCCGILPRVARIFI